MNSGLSLDRFSKGKKRPTKQLIQAKKRKVIDKSVQIRKFRKLKKKLQNEESVERDQSTGPTSFYDKFFAKLNQNESNSSETQEETTEKKQKPSRDHRPDPLRRARMKADEKTAERAKKQQEVEQARKKKQKIEKQRKRQHIKHVQKTRKGQPILEDRMRNILQKLQKKE